MWKLSKPNDAIVKQHSSQICTSVAAAFVLKFLYFGLNSFKKNVIYPI